MQALPFVFSLVIAYVIAPAMLRALRESGMERENYAGARVVFPLGVIVVAAAVIALVPVALIERFIDDKALRPEIGPVAIYTLGIALLGLIDDFVSGESRGWRGHGAALLSGSFPTGALKAVGALGLALLALLPQAGDGRYVVGALVLVLATNAFNLLDLRPGRAIKVFVALGVLTTLIAWDVQPLWALGLFAAPVLVVFLQDLNGVGMLGDTGSNVVGGLAGLWLVLAASTTVLVIALVVLIAFTVYAEYRSITELVEANPLLRRLDSLGRP